MRPARLCILFLLPLLVHFFVPNLSSVHAVEPQITVAFIGDQGSNSQPKQDPIAVLQLIKSKGADMVLHAGDFDYQNSPDGWDTTITSVLGADFPYFATIGNHDTGMWSKYQAKLQTRLEKLSGVTCSGSDLGINTYCRYKGISFVLSGVGTRGTGHVEFIRSSFSADTNPWKICLWHKNQATMQLGAKGDEAGWDTYETCRGAGAIIATGHEHSYSRTKTMVNFPGHTIDSSCPDGNSLCVSPGKTFAFVSGLGGKDIRDQIRCTAANQTAECPQWASMYTNTNKAGPDFGALFITFNVGGDPTKGHGEFITTDGVVRDSFDITTSQQPETSNPLQTTVRVMTFNTEPGSVPSCKNGNPDPINFSKKKIADLAAYIAHHTLDIAFLQEMQFRCGTYEEVSELVSELARINYSMPYVATVPYTPDLKTEKHFFRVATLSRFPILQDKVRYFPIITEQNATCQAPYSSCTYLRTPETRWFVFAPVESPFGTIHTYNLHTRNTEACAGVEDFFSVVDQDTHPLRFIGGDFNAELNRDQCKNVHTSYLLNRNTQAIDFLLLPQNAILSFVPGSLVIEHPIPSQHDTVISTIAYAGATLPPENGQPASATATPAPPTPTIIPEPTATPRYIITNERIPVMGIKLGNEKVPDTSWLDVVLQVFANSIGWPGK